MYNANVTMRVLIPSWQRLSDTTGTATASVITDQDAAGSSVNSFG